MSFVVWFVLKSLVERSVASFVSKSHDTIVGAC